MKKYKTEAPKKNIKFNTNRRPEIRDALDDRKNEEQELKGDDVTHNTRQTRNAPQKRKH